MKIEMKEITIRDVVNQYKDKKDEGVTGYGGLLNILFRNGFSPSNIGGNYAYEKRNS